MPKTTALRILREMAGFGWLLGLMIGAICPNLQAQADAPFAIRVESQEVVVPVVVLDRSHFRMPTNMTLEELDENVTDLSASDFHVYEDDVEQPIRNVAMELPRVSEVQDNVARHIEESFTPRGIWASADLGPVSGGGLGISRLAIYLVSYVPPAASMGACHRIKVKVKRRHATVHAREEYCNTGHGLSDPVSGTRIGRQMEDYAESMQVGGFPVSMQVGSLLGNAGLGRVEIAVEFPWSAVARKWVGVNLYATVAVMGKVYDKDGRVVARFSDMNSTAPWNFYRGPLPPDRGFLKSWELAGIPSRYETQIDLAPGEYKLQILVSDGEKFGRVEAPVKVQRVVATSLGISSIFLCKRFHERPAGAEAAERAAKYVPLATAGAEFTPTGNAHFARTERLLSYFEIYDAANGDRLTRFRMLVADAKTKEMKVDTGWRDAGLGRSGMELRNRTIPVAAEMEIEKLSPGRYRLEVEATDSGQRTSQGTCFVVE